jgi:hypothetical protein
MDSPTALLFFGLANAAGLLVLAWVLHAIGRLLPGLARACTHAPGLDLVVFAFVHGPWVAAGVVWARSEGGAGLLGLLFLTAVVSQMVTLHVWAFVHELVHRRHAGGPRISRVLNTKVGLVRNIVAVWWTALAVPVFTLIRLAEVLMWPMLVLLVKFPRYRQAEWVNVSRQKFDGLVGWDLIWCLYCDWMTGVWSLGGEMLRNVESFWCPIKFSSPEKCANCRVDYPDVESHWIKPPPEGGMQEVAALLDKQYPGPGGVNSWFNHPDRKVDVTIEGRSPKA